MGSRKIKILAIDDNRDNLISLNAVIKEAFPEAITLTALNGKEGLQLAASEDPDVILLDIVMPGMDGYEVCLKLKSDEKLCDIPVVFVTALKGDRERRIRALEAGAEAFITKPIDESELTAQVRAMIKIKTANVEKRNEKERLAALVEEQTRELKKKHTATLNLLEDFKMEIDARKKTEETLSNREKEYLILFDNAGDAIFIHDTMGNILNVNKVACERLGYTPEELRAMTTIDFNTPEFASLIPDQMRQLMVNKQNIFETCHVRKDGTLIPTEISSRLIEHNGKQTIMSVARDITERKRIQDALQKRIIALTQPLEDPSGIQFSDLFNIEEIQHIQDTFAQAAGVASIITEPDGTPITNPSNFRRLCSEIIRKTEKGLMNCFRSDAIIGRHDLSGPVIETCSSSGLWDAGASITIGGRHIANWLIGQVRNETQDEKDMLCYADEIGADRDEFQKALSEVPIMSNQQFEKVANALFLFASELSQKAYQNVQQSRFIAGQKQAERDLFTSERKFRDLLENVHLLAVMLDNEGNITFCNDYLLNLTGWAKEEVLNKNWFELFLPDDVGQTDYLTFIAGVAAGALPSHYENSILTREGNLRHIVWDNSILQDSEGQTIGTACIGSDVTDHMKLEEQLRQSQKMEAIGTLAGGVAHDFNNILTTITVFGTMAAKRVVDDEKTKEFIDEILAGANRAAELTRGLLTFSRKQTINLTQVDFNVIARRMDKMFVRILGEDIDLRTTLTDRNLPVVVDESQIEQVLMNLVTNARDAMPDGGSLAIQTDAISIDQGYAGEHLFESPGEYVVLTVSDTGIGMDLKTREKIFEPFFTTKEVGKGTGLGMAIVYGIIRQHKGNIDVDSEVGKGTTFKVFLPLTHVEEDVISEPAQALPAGNGETIIIAEDEALLRISMKLMLEDSGYKIIEAKNGEEAVKKFKENRGKVSLVILDVIMPVKDGKEAYEDMKATEPDIKAIFMSGYTDDTIWRKGILQEGFNFISKPVNPEILMRKIREVLNR